MGKGPGSGEQGVQGIRGAGRGGWLYIPCTVRPPSKIPTSTGKSTYCNERGLVTGGTGVTVRNKHY